MRLWCIADVELASACVSAGMRHSQCSALMLVRVDFAVDGVSRAACACAVRASALGYESWDYTVEYQSVVETVVSQLLKVSYSIRSVLVEQIDQHYAAVFKSNFRLLCHM
ncbi:hypothetical protein D3C79_998100 [compost metagenome]